MSSTRNDKNKSQQTDIEENKGENDDHDNEGTLGNDKTKMEEIENHEEYEATKENLLRRSNKVTKGKPLERLVIEDGKKGRTHNTK